MDSHEIGGDARASFQEIMHLLDLPPNDKSPEPVRRYMSTKAAWLPGRELKVSIASIRGKGKLDRPPNRGAYGGHAFAQAAWAMCRAMAESHKKKGTPAHALPGLHTIHGYFTASGYIDRPFIYTVTPTAEGRSFSTSSVIAHQPLSPSTNPAHDNFPVSDSLLPHGPPALTAMASFKSAAPHTAGGTISAAESPVQERFRSILSSRPPEAWPPCPPVDLDMIKDVVGTSLVGRFPGLEWRKVDMTAHNRGRPLHEQRELILYRLLAPLPADGTDGGWDANAHVCAHAYAADRNGLLMMANSLGIGQRAFGRAASLSYTLVVHVNAQEAVMKGRGWWVEECCFPRVGAGRGIVMVKIWSPEGVHVATEYQDGLCQAYEETGPAQKL